MLRCSVKLLMEGVQSSKKAYRGCVLTKALSTKTFVVKHDDVNHMFYIQLDNGMAVTAVTHFCAALYTREHFIFLVQNCRLQELYTFIWDPQKYKNIKLNVKGRQYQSITLYYIPIISHLFVRLTVMLPRFGSDDLRSVAYILCGCNTGAGLA